MNENIVIIPTYNEIENIEAIIKAVLSLKSGFNILIVDDGSPDGTADVVKKLMLEFPARVFILERTKKEGLGRAYIAGFKWCLEKEYNYIYEMDADFSHPYEKLEELYETCKIFADVAVGSRYKVGINVVNWPLKRVLLSYLASKYVRFITRMKINDTTAGFVGYKRKVLETINLDHIKMVGYAFQIEMKFKAWLFGYKIEEINIVFTDRQKGSSKMRGGIIGEAFFGVLKMKLKSVFNKKKYLR